MFIYELSGCGFESRCCHLKKTKKFLYQKALLSKRPQEIWKTIHRILNPTSSRIKTDPNSLKKHVNTATQQPTKATYKSTNKLKNITYNLLDSCQSSFKIYKVSIEYTKKKKRNKNDLHQSTQSALHKK